jgi:CRP/FNR family transcriptional regulator, cyclic AMP receptor protein
VFCSRQQAAQSATPSKEKTMATQVTPSPLRQAGCAAPQVPGASRTVADCLKGADLFTALSDAEITRLAACARQRPCARGETVVAQNDPAGEHLLVVVDGEVAVIVEGVDGKETIVALLKRGDYFGEMSLIDGSARGATVRATTDARLITLRGEDIMRGLRDWPGFALTLLGEFARRLRQSNAKVAALAHQRVERRVAGVMLQLFEERGVRLRDETGRRCVILRNRPTQQHLAEMAGTSRETVSRVITAWEKQGLVREHVRDIFLFDEPALRCM